MGWSRPALTPPRRRPFRRAATSTAVLALALGGLVGGVSSAAAAAEAEAQDEPETECPDAAGEHTAFDPIVEDDPEAVGMGELDGSRMSANASDPYALIVRGGGWGHGVGMSQYGARGAALLGCDHVQILETYFPGVEVAERDTDVPIRVGLWPNTPSGTAVTVITVNNVGDAPLPWALAPLPEGMTPPPEQPVGVTWTVRAEPGGGFTLRDGPAADAAVIWPESGVAGAEDSTLTADLAPTRVSLASKSADYQRGLLEFGSRGASGMTVVAVLPTIEQYLYGLGEVPSSWPAEALAAQAVAGRSYALTALDGAGRANCQCDLYDSVFDQAYVGAGKEDGTYGPAWVAAVDLGAGRVLTFDHEDGEGPQVVRAYYSSSNGGSTSAAWDIWGSDPDTYPYLAPVNSAVWDAVDMTGGNDDEQPGGGPDGEPDNPFHRWSSGFSADELAALFGMDTVKSVKVVERAPGGRPCRQVSGSSPCTPRDLDGDGVMEQAAGAVVRGVADGGEEVLAYDSEGIRSALAGYPRMLSGLVAFNDDEPPFEPPPVVVDRISGDDRIATAVELSRAAWSTSKVVVLARADDPADALAGAGLAGLEDAPLLLTRTATLPDEVAAEITRLEATRVVLLGGQAAISRDVADALGELEVDVERVQGDDRFATAVAIAMRIAPEGAERVLIIRGRVAGAPERSWPDALAVSGVAARQAAAGAPWPVLAIEDTVPDVTMTAITDLAPDDVLLIGGQAVVSPESAQAIRDAGFVTERVGGDDRYGTSRLVTALDDPAGQHVVVATGANFPDGLAAGPYAARTNGVLLLVPKAHDPARSPWLAEQHHDLLAGLGWPTAEVTVVGGLAAVEVDVVGAVDAALRAGIPADE